MIENLRKATQDVIYISKAKHPFHVNSIDESDLDLVSYLRGLSFRSKDAIIKEETLNEFFRSQIRGGVPLILNIKEHAEKFIRLKRILEDSLSDIKVYRIGLIHMDVYIVGKIGSRFVILSTEVVEPMLTSRLINN